MPLFRKRQESDETETYIMNSSIYKDIPTDRRDIMQIAIICLMSIVLIVCVFILIDRSRQTNSAPAVIQETYDVQTPPVPTAVPQDSQQTSADNVQRTYKMLDKYMPYIGSYPELVGWIKIDGVNVDYPVVQSKDYNNPHFYLDKGPDKKESNHGAIFLDTRNSATELDRHTVIYGHNMNDGTMFGSLDKYKNRYFRNEHLTLQFDTLYDEYKWEIINIFITNTEFYYIQTYFENDDDFLSLMNKCLSKSLYKNDVIISPEDKILTLSTCTKDIKDGRLVVQARLIVDKNDVEKN